MPLFERMARGVRLSDRGRRYRDALAVAFAGIERATAQARASEVEGRLRLSVPESFAASWLSPRLASLGAALPGLELELLTGSAHADLRGGEADLAVRFGAGDYPGVASERLMGDGVSVLAPAGSGLDALRTSPLLIDTGATEGEPWMRWPAWLDEAGIEVASGRRAVRLPTASLCTWAAAASAGICVGRLSIAHPLLDEGRLVALLPWRSTEYSYYLVMRFGELDHPRLHAFRHWLRAELHAFADAAATAVGFRPPTPPSTD